MSPDDCGVLSVPNFLARWIRCEPTGRLRQTLSHHGQPETHHRGHLLLFPLHPSTPVDILVPCCESVRRRFGFTRPLPNVRDKEEGVTGLAGEARLDYRSEAGALVHRREGRESGVRRCLCD